jgi:hypothetical protein
MEKDCGEGKREGKQTMAEQSNDLEALAVLAANVPKERRRLLEEQLPFGDNPRFDAGLVAGLVRASEIIAQQHGEAVAHSLQEIAAVAAARVLQEQQALAQMRAWALSPGVREEIEAEIERIKRGAVKLISMEEILREMEELVA